MLNYITFISFAVITISLVGSALGFAVLETTKQKLTQNFEFGRYATESDFKELELYEK